MAPVPPGVAGATIVVSSRNICLYYCEGPAESPSEAAQPECCHISLLHYAGTAFAASALRLYIICCPMARTLLTSQ